ncbi:two-component system sensor histidine kinase NtrB [Blastochloris viridis]|uniref:Sensor protein FixL n=1 Tax=Blastochloris viridis TaxID=1079 RepID=A0A182D0R4_BLAVI|nr:PAS domain S-box protein [Blastochloris viridis]ALK08345.1 Sensor protein FixL [Blastochloris viridis]BAR98382.1 two-component oxygen-sensor histidine kinase FixL [Blastochloris viridis]
MSLIHAFVNPRSVSDARLDSVLDTAVDGIVVIDESGSILVFNQACEKLFGWNEDEVRGHNISILMPEDYASKHDDYVANYLTTGVRKIIGIGREVRGQHRNGTSFPVELSVGEAITPEGRQFVGFLSDLRPRKEAEQRLNQLQTDLLHMARVSAMDEMGAALAHELNQPLTAVMLYLQAISRANARETARLGGSSGFSENTKLILDKAVREAERAGNIIQRMRQFVEKREPERRLLDLNPLVDDAVELTLLGHRRGTRMTRALTDNLPQVLVDPVQIQQIVVNLVRNALEVVKNVDSPEVQVTTRTCDDMVEMAVEDNGPGIPPDAVPNLFRAFVTSKRTGLGLGLAISRTIAQNHGGDLTVDPGGNGHGACFVLKLPISRTAPS